MSAKKLRVPTYRKHPNGQAFVEFKGKRHYLGVYDSDSSRQRYREIVNEILATGGLGPGAIPLDGTAKIDECVLAYLVFAEGYYGSKDKEFLNLKMALKYLSEMFAKTTASTFGPRSLSTLRERWIQVGWVRSTINHQIGRVRRFFRWCGSQELIPGEVSHRLTCLDALRPGRSKAKEGKKVLPAVKSQVDAVLPYLSPTVAAMVQVQYLCGMRPSEVCQMKGSDIDTSGSTWLYRVPEHKNDWRGQVLIKAIPAIARGILAPYILKAASGGHLFNPVDTLIAMGRKNTKRKKKEIRDHYDRDSYRKAVNYGFKKAERHRVEIQTWHPNQLRHLIATEISQSLGQQAAQRWLGHADLNTTAIYAEKEVKELVSIAQELDRRWAS